MGLDVATAARVLGKRPGAVRTAAHRGLRRLSDRLADSTRDEAAGEHRVDDRRAGGGDDEQR
jgi:RNA polymerase sigma-70 factor (ECF subfamily)